MAKGKRNPAPVDDPAVAAATAQAASDDAPLDDEPIVDTSAAETQVVDDVVDDDDDAGVVETQPATETQGTQPAAPPQPSWRDKLGPNFAKLDEDAAIAQLQASLAQAQQAQQWAYIAAQNEGQLRAFQQQQQQAAQQQAQQAQAAEAAKKKREIPPFDPAWLQLVTRDEHDNVISKPGAMPDLPAKIAAYAKFRDDEISRFVNDRDGYLKEAFQDTFAAEVDQRVQSAIVQYQELQEINSIEREYEGVLYQPGTKQPTQLGATIIQQAQGLMQYGMPASRAMRQAIDQVRGHIATSELAKQNNAQTASQQAQAANAKKKQELLNGSAKRPNRTGTFPRSETRATAAPQNNRLSFFEMARDYAKEEGLWDEPAMAQ